MKKYWSPAPNWSKLFLDRPDLEAPNYQETLAFMALGEEERAVSRFRAKMQEIHKEKTSYRNKNRNATKSKRKNPSAGF